MKAKNITASIALAGGLAAGAFGVGAGVANADTGPGHGGPVATRWGPPPPPHHDQWGGPGRYNGGGYYDRGGYYGGGPIPGGWNGGWEPNGGFCLGPFCV